MSCPRAMDADWLRLFCLDAGADDVGFVAIDRPEVDDQRAEVLAAFPATRTLVSFVCRLNPEPIRSPARSVANQEFHANYEHVNEVARKVVRALVQAGVPAMNPTSAFPMEMDRYPGRIWVARTSRSPSPPGWARSDSTAASSTRSSAASSTSGPSSWRGTSRPGTRRSTTTRASSASSAWPPARSAPSARRPLRLLGLRHAQLPRVHERVHRLGGDDRRQPGRERLPQPGPASESASMWQSLSFKANYKAAYCVAVCPAGEDVIGPFLDDRRGFLEGVVDPLKAKAEPVYVVPGRTPRGTSPDVSRGRPSGVSRDPSRLDPGVPLRDETDFPAEASRGLAATYHFTFTGREPADATVAIRDRTLAVQMGIWRGRGPDHRGQRHMDRLPGQRTGPDLGVAPGEDPRSGPARLLAAFGKCFPS